MPKFLIQITEVGGVEGCRVVEGDSFQIEGNGVVVYKDNDPVFACPEFKIVCDLACKEQIESDTLEVCGGSE